MMKKYKVSYQTMIDLVCFFVETEIKFNKFQITSSPVRHEQQVIVNGFETVIDVSFNSCANEINGHLIWIQKQLGNIA